MVSFAPLEKALAYADDTHTSSGSIQELTRDSEVLVDLSSELGLSLNPAKTQLPSTPSTKRQYRSALTT